MNKDTDYMRKALQLARNGCGFTSPNPMVGAVIVKDGKIISEGYHMKYVGFHAERNAIFNMLTNGEHEIKRILAIMTDGKMAAPCGACRELMAQLMPNDYSTIEILLDYESERIITLGEITPEWWI